VPLDVDRTAVIGRWVRHGPDDAGPAWPPIRVPPPDGRWQRGDVLGALYLADSEETAWAEWYRHLAEKGIPPNEQLPRRIWLWEVDVRVANLSTPARLERVGLAAPTPGKETWQPYQDVGHQLRREGCSGLLAPSAARPRGRVLCLFRDGGERIGGVRQVGRGRRIDEPPAPPTGMTT
jgi:RES domain-containing protein